MKILVVSDTHGREMNLQEAIKKESPFDMFIHCGDSEDLGDYISVYTPAKTVFVCGNCDICCPYPWNDIVSVPGHRIFVTHGHMYNVKYDLHRLASEAKSHGCDVALFGHTHEPLNDFVDGVHIFNPGSISLPRQASRLCTYGVIEASETSFSMALQAIE